MDFTEKIKEALKTQSQKQGIDLKNFRGKIEIDENRELKVSILENKTHICFVSIKEMFDLNDLVKKVVENSAKSRLLKAQHQYNDDKAFVLMAVNEEKDELMTIIVTKQGKYKYKI